jgi:hypothetical protein
MFFAIHRTQYLKKEKRRKVRGMKFFISMETHEIFSYSATASFSSPYMRVYADERYA